MSLAHAFTEAPYTGLGGCWDPRGTGLSLEELARLSNEVSPSPVSVVVPDRSTNPFHMSGNVDFFLLRDQERDKFHAVSTQDQGLPQRFLPLHKQQQPDFPRAFSPSHSHSRMAHHFLHNELETPPSSQVSDLSHGHPVSSPLCLGLCQAGLLGAAVATASATTPLLLLSLARDAIPF